MHSNMGRTLNLPPYEFNHGVVHLSSMRVTTSVNHSSLAIQSDRLQLTHWGRVTHICVSKLYIVASDNGLSPVRRQAIIWTNAGILLIGPWGKNFSEILIDIHTFSFKKIDLKMSSAKWRPFCLGLNVLTSKTPSHSIVARPTSVAPWFLPHRWQDTK